MKIAYLIGNFPVLSETFVAQEIERLHTCGLNVRVFAFGMPNAADLEKLTPSLRDLMRDTQYLFPRRIIAAAAMQPLAALRGWGANQTIHAAASLKPRRSWRLIRALGLIDRMRREGITHVHAHWPYATQVAYLAHRMAGISFSISIHAHEVAHENGHFPLIFESVSFAAFCNRGAMKHLLAQLPPEAQARAHLVYHGVDLERFRPLPLPPAAAPLSIISAGRLTPTKGFDRLIRGCAAARAAGIDVRLTILGRGGCESSLRALAQTEGIAEYVDMPGWVSHDQMTAYLRNAHVFALLADTTFHDGLPNVLLEAMASGRPVILSPLPAANEAVTEGGEGFILNHPDDTPGFVAALGQLNGDSDRMRVMGAAASARVRRDHDAQVQITHLVDLFKRIGADACEPVARALIQGT